MGAFFVAGALKLHVCQNKGSISIVLPGMTTCSRRTSSAADHSTNFLDRGHIRNHLDQIFGQETLHPKQIESLTNGVAGVMRAAFLGIHAIGEAYSQLAATIPKHGIKQVDRLMSNPAYDIWRLLKPWATFILGQRRKIVLALDWTDFDDDDHTTLCAYVITEHGRATPLAWRTVLKSELKDMRNQYEMEMIVRLQKAFDPEVHITLLADRGFGDQEFYEFLELYGWDFIIRFRQGILVEYQGQKKLAAHWLSPTGRPRMLSEARVTRKGTKVPAVIVTRAKRMKEIWCLATTRRDLRAGEIAKLYGKRFTIEETFRDQKDMHFGMGLRATHIRKAERRDRLLLLAALAQVLLTLLGAAAEEIGLDRQLKANTVKRRTHSLFRQGLHWYGAMPDMPPKQLLRLLRAFGRILIRRAVCKEILAVI